MRSLRALLLCAQACAVLAAQGWQQKPVEVGDGELLLFAAPAGLGPDRADGWHVVTLAGPGEAHLFLTTKQRLAVSRRLDRSRIVMSGRSPCEGLWVIDLCKGTALDIGARSPRLVGVHAAELVFLDDGRLRAQPWQKEGAARSLGDQPFADAMLGGDAVLGVAPGPDRRLWRVDLAGGGATDLGPLPEAAGLPGTTLAIAPDGAHYAVGLADGTLRVHALADGRLVREWSKLPIALPPQSSVLPQLEIAFRGADTVVCSETRSGPAGVQFVFVERSVATGAVLAETPCETGRRHRSPPPATPLLASLRGSWPGGTQRVRRGCFDCQGTELFYAGGNDKLAVSVPELPGEGSIELTPGGGFALVPLDGELEVLDVIDGAQRVRRRVFAGISTGRTWLPTAR
jgi:hypothetical protein